MPLAGILEILNGGVADATSTVIHCVDNQSMMEVVRTGRNPTMRHLGRVHGVCIGFLHEQYSKNDGPPTANRPGGGVLKMEYVSSSLMLADIYTKEFTDEQKWNSLKRQIGILSPVERRREPLLTTCHC